MRKTIATKALEISLIFHEFDQEEIELTKEEESFWEELTNLLESYK